MFERAQERKRGKEPSPERAAVIVNRAYYRRDVYTRVHTRGCICARLDAARRGVKIAADTHGSQSRRKFNYAAFREK